MKLKAYAYINNNSRFISSQNVYTEYHDPLCVCRMFVCYDDKQGPALLITFQFSIVLHSFTSIILLPECIRHSFFFAWIFFSPKYIQENIQIWRWKKRNFRIRFEWCIRDMLANYFITAIFPPLVDRCHFIRFVIETRQIKYKKQLCTALHTQMSETWKKITNIREVRSSCTREREKNKNNKSSRWLKTLGFVEHRSFFFVLVFLFSTVIFLEKLHTTITTMKDSNYANVTTENFHLKQETWINCHVWPVKCCRN